MPNPFKYLEANPNGLVRKWLPVTPNDSTDNVGTNNVAVGLYIGTSGQVSWIDVDGDTTGPIPVSSGVIIPGSFKRVLVTGTDASNIWALISV